MYRTVKIYTLKPTPQQWPHPHSLNQSPVAGVVKIRFVQIQLICQQSRCGTVRCGAVWCEQGARRASTSSRQGSAVFSVQCAVCSVQCAVCSVQCAVCSVQCAVCSVQCAVQCSASPDGAQSPGTARLGRKHYPCQCSTAVLEPYLSL
jgi:hypothetical protein